MGDEEKKIKARVTNHRSPVTSHALLSKRIQSSKHPTGGRMAQNDERNLRHDVALANRIIERLGLSAAFGHASARIPGTNTFYIPTRRSPGLADETNLLVMNTDGTILDGVAGTPNSEFWIHARIYAARPEVNGIVHAHPLACISLTQIGEPHRVVHHQ